MHNALVTRPQLNRANILRIPQIDGQDKISKNIAATCRQLVRLRHLHRQVRRTHLPSFRKMRFRGQISRYTLRGSLFYPLCDETQLSVREAPLTDEITETGLGQPRGHEATLGHCDNLQRMIAYVLVSEQWEWRCLSRSVAR